MIQNIQLAAPLILWTIVIFGCIAILWIVSYTVYEHAKYARHKKNSKRYQERKKTK